MRAIDAHEAEFGADGYRAFPGDAPEPDYNAVKEAHPDDLVLYQVGDKFELYGEDAKEAARLLKLISLESRQTVDYDKAVSIGFSIHADVEIEILRASRNLTICTVNEDGRREVRSLSRSHKAERESAPVSMDDPDRFSVRSLDEQGEMFGIWDAALGRFYVEGEKILIVSGRDAADNYLSNIQRTRGIQAPKESISTELEREAPVADNSEPGIVAAGTGTPPAPAEVPEATGAGASEAAENAEKPQAEPNLTPNVEQYIMLKSEHPDKLIGVQVGDYMLFYGKDAEAAAPALRANLLTRDISGLGETYVTGRPLSWQWVIQRLLENGHSAVLARPDPERGPDAPY